MIHHGLIAACLFVVTLQGCSTTCHQTLVDGSGRGQWNAELRYRVCGGASGYSVAIYSSDEEAPGVGEGDKEPFQAVYKYSLVEEKHVSDPPVKIEWKGDKHLLIRHDTRRSIEDARSVPMIIKADTVYQDVSIDYDPEPVIWRK